MEGPLKLADGSAVAPSLTFNSDPSIGFYKNGNFIASTKPITGVLPVGLGPLPWSRTTAPPGWVLCYGQTLSRTAYADLWAVAQIEIANGNALYNNGDGSMTFGILDMRGRVSAAWDAMGGVGAGRLGIGYGVGGGSAFHSLIQSELPGASYALAGNPGAVNVTSARNDIVVSNGGLPSTGLNNGIFQITHLNPTSAVGVMASSGTFTPTGTIGPIGSNAPHNNVQPTLVSFAILYAGA